MLPRLSARRRVHREGNQGMPRLGQLLRPRSRVSIVAATGLVLGILYLPALPASAESSNVALSVSLTQGEGNATAGMPWAYVITVSNAPDAGASNGYTVSLDIPDGTTVDQIDAGCTDAGNTVDCTSGALAPDSSDVFNVSLNVGSDFADGGALGTSANITDINGDTDLTTDDDQSSVQTTVDAVADLGIDKGGPDGSDPIVVAGDPAGYDYTLTVSNNGPSDTAFTVSDTLPDGLTFDSGDGCSATGQAVTCTGTIAAGADAKVFTVTVLADPSVPDASILENDATVAADNGTEDPNSENNTSGTVSTTITAQADLSPTLTILGGPFTAGGANFSGTVRVDNNGDSDNTGGFSVNVPLPTDVVFISGATGCSSVAGGFTCSTTSGLAAGAHKDFSITLRAKSNVPAATYPLTATVTSSGTVDPIPGNNASTPATDVAVITRADLSLTTAAITYPSSQTAAWANTNTAQNFAIYEYNVTNNGPSDAQSVSFADSLPTGVTIVGACFGTVSCSP